MKFTREGDTYTITFDTKEYSVSDLEEYKMKNDEMLESKTPIHIIYEASNLNIPPMSILMPLVWYMMSKKARVREIVKHTTIRCTTRAKLWFDRLFLIYKPASSYTIEVLEP